MSDLLKNLIMWGCDVSGAMERMDDDEEFYLECLKDVVDDAYFERLHESLVQGDTNEAFNAAHALKGVLVNVGLTPMYDKTVEIVEPLRNGQIEGLLMKYAELDKMRNNLNTIIRG